MISIGVLQRQQVPTRCSSGLLPEKDIPRPSYPKELRTGIPKHVHPLVPAWQRTVIRLPFLVNRFFPESRLCCFHQWTSCLSPRCALSVTAPEPNPGSTASSYDDGDLVTEQGERTGKWVPIFPGPARLSGGQRPRHRLRGVQGRVVAISTPSKSKSLDWVSQSLGSYTHLCKGYRGFTTGFKEVHRVLALVYVPGIASIRRNKRWVFAKYFGIMVMYLFDHRSRRP